MCDFVFVCSVNTEKLLPIIKPLINHFRQGGVAILTTMQRWYPRKKKLQASSENLDLYQSGEFI